MIKPYWQGFCQGNVPQSCTLNIDLSKAPRFVHSNTGKKTTRKILASALEVGLAQSVLNLPKGNQRSAARGGTIDGGSKARPGSFSSLLCISLTRTFPFWTDKILVKESDEKGLPGT